MKKISLLSIIMSLGFMAFAQTPFNMQYGTYAQTFDALANTGTGHTNFPTGWGINELGSGSNSNGEYRAGTGSSGTGDTYSFGAANSTDRSLGGVASGSVQPEIGFGFTNNTGTTITQIDVAFIMEQWREGSGAGLDSCYFSYSTNASSLGDTSATWTSASILDLYSASNTMTTGALDGNLALNQISMSGTLNVSLAASTSIYMKWRDLNSAGSDDGLSVDDFSLVLFDASGPITPAPAAPPSLLAMNPMDNDLNVAYTATSMSMTFSDSITVIGTGDVTLVDLNTAANNISVAASALTQSADGKTFSYNALSLNPGTPYAINIDSTCFSSGAYYPGIYNNTDWNFTTTAAPTTATSLNETFTGCNNPNFGVFTAYSEVGGQNWRCNTFGNGDTNAVSMNGFSSGSQDNEDWLISPPLDLSAMNMPILEFYSKLRFSGNNTKELFVSANYAGVGSPASASWTAIQIPNWSALDTNWNLFNSIDLTNYKSSTFHLAFKYVSTSAGTSDEWSIDDVLVTEGATGLNNWASAELDIKVLGDTRATLNLLSTSAKDRKLDYQIIELSGRVITEGEIQVLSGKMFQSVNLPNLANGMYLLNLNNSEGRTLVKFMVK